MQKKQHVAKKLSDRTTLLLTSLLLSYSSSDVEVFLGELSRRLSAHTQNGRELSQRHCLHGWWAQKMYQCQVCSSNPDCVGGDCGQRNKQSEISCFTVRITRIMRWLNDHKPLHDTVYDNNIFTRANPKVRSPIFSWNKTTVYFLSYLHHFKGRRIIYFRSIIFVNAVTVLGCRYDTRL